jgi:hypothetical protein
VIRIKQVESEQLPSSLEGIAIHRPGDIMFVVRRGLTGQQLADTITELGAGMTWRPADGPTTGPATAADQ